MSGRRQTPDASRRSEDRITIRGIEVFAHHGVLSSEKENGQTFLVDVELLLDLSDAAVSDRLEDTIDYGEIAQRIHEVVGSERWDLIEKVAGRVAEVGMQDRRVSQIKVTVHKPEAPIAVSFGDVAVTLTRTRE